MIEVPFHKLAVAVWNNKTVACVCAFIHMGAIKIILLFSYCPVRWLYIALFIY